MNISLSMLFKKQYCGTLVFVFIKSIFFYFQNYMTSCSHFHAVRKKRICLETNYVYLKYYRNSIPVIIDYFDMKTHIFSLTKDTKFNLRTIKDDQKSMANYLNNT